MTVQSSQDQTPSQAFWTEVHERHASRLTVIIAKRMPRLLVRSHSVEDVLQETFCRAWFQRKKLVNPDGNGDFAWLWGIAHRVLLEWIQQASRRRMGVASGLLLSSTDPGLDREFATRITRASQRVLRSESVQRMLEILDQLDRAESEIILWREYDGLSHQEIAERLDIQASTARKRLQRARRRMEHVRKELERERGEVALPHEITR